MHQIHLYVQKLDSRSLSSRIC